jgi:histidinol-phosphate aminotransferase
LPIGDYSAVLAEYCERAGVVLRGFPGVGVRITIGTADENDRLLRVVRAATEDGATG